MAYKQRWLQYFDLLDGNGNGVIDPGDAEAVTKVIEASGHFSPAAIAQYKQHVSEVITNLIKEYDSNKDGKVTKEEWLSGIEKTFVGKSTAPVWWNDVLGKFFATVDTNNNGEISEEEYVKAVTNITHGDAGAVKAAYHHHKGAGKFDIETFRKVFWIWATSPNPEPEVELLTPFLRKN